MIDGSTQEQNMQTKHDAASSKTIPKDKPTADSSEEALAGSSEATLLKDAVATTFEAPPTPEVAEVKAEEQQLTNGTEVASLKHGQKASEPTPLQAKEVASVETAFT